MKDYNKIQESIDKSFQDFIVQTLRLNGDKLKYFYWTKEFFEVIGNLSFQYYTLTLDQKEKINTIGDFYFESDHESIFFEVNKNSHRHDILIKNINKLFSEKNRAGQSYKYEYLKEYIFWQILEKVATSSKNLSKEKVEQQRKNFLITYLNYLLDNGKKPAYEEWKDYKRFTLTNQGQALIAKLDELDKKGVDNKKLREKLNSLYINRSLESKLHFIFSKEGGGEKEELRELLDVMGKEETGKFYRGQTDSTWKLNSSLTRENTFLVNEKEMYYEILSLKPDAFVNDTSVYERLITMQHFGMPTRLMDITRNPLIAVFFACNNRDRIKSDGTIFIFNPQNEDFLNFEDDKLELLKRLYKNKSGYDEPNPDEDNLLSEISFIRGIAKNQRINNQSGDFIFVGSGKDIGDKLNNLPSMFIIIDAPTKRVLLEQLESLNIHGGAVYPDLTNLSTYIKNKYTKNNSDKSKDDDFGIDLTPKPPKSKPPSKVVSEKIFEDSTNVEVKALVTNRSQAIEWTENSLLELKNFAKTNGLVLEVLKKIIDDYLAFSTIPLRDTIIEAMIEKPTLKQRKDEGERLKKEIIEFADQFRS